MFTIFLFLRKINIPRFKTGSNQDTIYRTGVLIIAACPCRHDVGENCGIFKDFVQPSRSNIVFPLITNHSKYKPLYQESTFHCLCIRKLSKYFLPLLLKNEKRKITDPSALLSFLFFYFSWQRYLPSSTNWWFDGSCSHTIATATFRQRTKIAIYIIKDVPHHKNLGQKELGLL